MWWQFRGNSQTQMNSIIYRTHLGRLLCPKPSLFNYFQGISRFSGKLGGPWDLPCVFPIPLRATVALFPLFGVPRWSRRPVRRPKSKKNHLFLNVFHDLTYLIPSSASQPSPAQPAEPRSPQPCPTEPRHPPFLALATWLRPSCLPSQFSSS